MVQVARLSPQQARLTASSDEGNIRLAQVLAGRADLAAGDEGPAVRYLQRLLNGEGYNLDVDGDFGPLTRGAVKRYQRSRRLADDGIVGKNTLRRLLRDREPEHRLLKLGSRGDDVEKLERNLHTLGYLERDEIGGTYDRETAEGVKQFRRDQRDLRNTNGEVAGGPTQEALAREVRQLRHAPEHTRVRRTDERLELDRRTLTAARSDEGIGEGDNRRAVVSNVQRHLKAAGYDPQRNDGTFDERTGATVRAFQRRSDLPVTGRVDEATWQKLRRSILLAEDGTSPPQRIGERSQAVLRTERLLDRAGYDPGKVDGKFDRNTMRALKRFERAHPRAGDADSVGDRQIREIERAARNGGLVKPIDARLTSISEFGVPDAEGAPSSRGGRFHAGKDWFAPAGATVRAPVSGRIVEVRPSVGNSGQVFGGTVKVQAEDGKVWVFRHVDPRNVRTGQRVNAGDPIARITNWTGGPDHAHIELWKTLGGGYRYENMIDPMRYLRRFL